MEPRSLWSFGIDDKDLEPTELPHRDAGSDKRLEARSLLGELLGDEASNRLSSTFPPEPSDCSSVRFLASSAGTRNE